MNGKPCCRGCSKLACLAAAVAAITLIEIALIIGGVLQPVSSYSPGNLLFALARIAVVAYAGIVFAKQGLKKAAANGAILGLTTAVIMCLVSLASKPFFNKSIIGLSASSNGMLAILFALLVLQNAVIFAAVAVLTAWIAIRFGKPSRPR